MNEEEDTVICAGCGLETDESFRFHSKNYCPDCVGRCGQCGTEGVLSLMENVYYYTNRNRRAPTVLCNNCIGHASRCSCCEETFMSGSYQTCECGDEVLCHHCHEEEGWYCSCMSDHEDDDDSDSNFIHNYDYKPIPIFYPPIKRPMTLYLGVEEEVDRVQDREGLCEDLFTISNGEELFYLKRDGSLSDEGGLEIVTHPMTINYHRTKMVWKEIIGMCETHSAKSHNAGNCGLHVHFNKDFFGSRDSIEICSYKLMLIMSKFVEQISRFSRRKEFDYCSRIYINKIREKLDVRKSGDIFAITLRETDDSIIHTLSPERLNSLFSPPLRRRSNVYTPCPPAERYPNPVMSSYESLEELAYEKKWRIKSLKFQTDSGKYQAINFSNRHTIEIRIWRGTLQHDTLMATLEMTNGMVKACKYNSVATIEKMTWDQLVASIMSYDKPKYLHKYLIKRGLYMIDDVIAKNSDDKKEIIEDIPIHGSRMTGYGMSDDCESYFYGEEYRPPDVEVRPISIEQITVPQSNIENRFNTAHSTWGDSAPAIQARTQEQLNRAIRSMELSTASRASIPTMQTPIDIIDNFRNMWYDENTTVRDIVGDGATISLETRGTPNISFSDRYRSAYQLENDAIDIIFSDTDTSREENYN
jgi:hypothetical protein